MLDNVLIPIIIKALIDGEVIAAIPGMPIAAAFQPTQQGASTEPTAYIYKIADKRYGYVGYEDVWDDVNGVMIHRETQNYETTFQLSALVTQDPALPNQYTAADILNYCSSILQSQATVAALQAQDVGIERVTDVRNPYFLDDRHQFEASPSFDFVIMHKQIIQSQGPFCTAVDVAVYEI